MSSTLRFIWLCALLLSAHVTAAARSAPDLPSCDVVRPLDSPELTIGLTFPYAAPDVTEYALGLSSANPDVTVCREGWGAIVPRLRPGAKHLERGYGYGFFVGAFLLTVAALGATVPRHWWRRTSLVGVLAVVGTSWLLAIALLALFHWLGGQRLMYGTVVSLRAMHGQPSVWLDVHNARELDAAIISDFRAANMRPAIGIALAPSGPSVLQPGAWYRLKQGTNFRSGPGVQYACQFILPRGETIAYDGAVAGDWWRVSTSKGKIGWVTSLWIRRQEELRRLPMSLGIELPCADM